MATVKTHCAMRRAAVPAWVLLTIALGIGLLLSGCTNPESTPATVSSPSDGAPGSAAAGSTTSEPAREPNPDISPEQQALLDELLQTPLPLAQVQERIAAAGYTSRVVEIDGEPQPATMDYRLDRINLETTAGQVTDAYWG